MRKIAILLLISIWTTLACESTLTADNAQKHVLPKEVGESSRSPLDSKAIGKKPDFTNFSYPWIPKGYEGLFSRRTSIDLDAGHLVRLNSDEAHLFDVAVDVDFVDVTGDKIDEALVTVSILLPNRAIPSCIFVYEPNLNSPKLLWKYESGRRDVKGFKDVSVSNGNLVVEEFDVKDSPICCPTSYYRSTFVWKDGTLELASEETVPNSSQSRNR